MRSVLVHGFNVKDDGEKTIGKLSSYLPNSIKFNYGWLGFLGVRFKNKKLARQLASIVKTNDNVYCHSNGCSIVAIALKIGMVCDRITYIHPALDVDDESVTSDNFNTIRIFYSAKDTTTWFARFLIFHPWGAMGTYGSSCVLPNVVNIDDGFKHSEGFTKNPRLYLEPPIRKIHG